MTISELQKKYSNDAKGLAKEIRSMTREQIQEVIDSCGIAQGKIVTKRLWEKLTGKKY